MDYPRVSARGFQKAAKAASALSRGREPMEPVNVAPEPRRRRQHLGVCAVEG